MFTTEGISFSAKSAKDPGVFCEYELNEKLKSNINDEKKSYQVYINY